MGAYPHMPPFPLPPARSQASGASVAWSLGSGGGVKRVPRLGRTPHSIPGSSAISRLHGLRSAQGKLHLGGLSVTEIGVGLVPRKPAFPGVLPCETPNTVLHRLVLLHLMTPRVSGSISEPSPHTGSWPALVSVVHVGRCLRSPVSWGWSGLRVEGYLPGMQSRPESQGRQWAEPQRRGLTSDSPSLRRQSFGEWRAGNEGPPWKAGWQQRDLSQWYSD